MNKEAKKYGIRMTLIHWAAIDGGDDLVGTKEEMDQKTKEWTDELKEEQKGHIFYEVFPYTEDNSKLIQGYVEYKEREEKK